MKKLTNKKTFRQLNIEGSVNKKSNSIKETDSTQLFFVKGTDNRNPQSTKNTVVSKKVKRWAGFQIIKAFIGIPTLPVK